MRRLMPTVLVAATLALAACGGDDGDKRSADAYAADFCRAAQEWVDAIRSGANDLRNLGANATPQQGKDALERFFDRTVEDTEAFSRKLDDAGTPDVSGGEEAAEQLERAVDQSKGVLSQARSQTARLPVESEQRFSIEARKVGRSTRDSLSRVGDAIAEPQSSELREAFRQSPGCQRLRNRS